MFLLVVLILGVSVLGNGLPSDKAELVRTGVTLFEAALGLGPFLNPSPEGTPLSDLLFISIPAAAAATATGTIAGRCIAKVTLALEPSLLLSPILSATRSVGLGVEVKNDLLSVEVG